MKYSSCINLRPIVQYGYDLSTKKDLCNLIGREEEIQNILETVFVCGDSAILLGEAGSGKTSIVEKLALDIKNRQMPFLKNKVIFCLNLAQLVSGTKHRGEFEAKMIEVLEFCKQNKGKIILFIDEIHMLNGLGSSEGNTVDAINILKPYVSNGDVTILGATTKDEYEEYISKDHAFVRRFENIEVSVPDKDMVIKILYNYIDQLCNQFEISLGFDEETKMYYLEKIFDITDGKCAYVTADVKVENPTLAKKVLKKAFSFVALNGGKKLLESDMDFAISKYSSLSIEFISQFGYDLSKQKKLCNLVGRKDELDKIIKAIAIKKKSVLLIGESGTGKTSIVEKLALDIKNNECPYLNDKIIFYVNVTSLISDIKHSGEFEKNMNKLINWCRKYNGKIILFIDEIHMLNGLGTSDSMNAMNILKPYIMNEEVIMIGATTKDEYEKYIATDYAFASRLENIEISSLSEKDKIDILLSYSGDLSLKYKINLDLSDLSKYKIMEYIVKLTDVKNQTRKGKVPVGNPTLSKRVLENAYTSAVYLKKGVVTLEDICFSILDCDSLCVDFRKQCAEELKIYANNRNGDDMKDHSINVPVLSRGSTIGFTASYNR